MLDVIIILHLVLVSLFSFYLWNKIASLKNEIRIVNAKQEKMIRTSLQPNKQDVIRNYRKAYPNASKAQCFKDTGISKPTIAKWWNVEKGE